MTEFRCGMNYISLRLLILALAVSPLWFEALAQDRSQNATEYRLESFEFDGSTRLSAEQAREQLGIRPDIIMNDAWISSARTSLMGLGLFKDVVFKLRKGSKPGLIKLVIIAQDDEDVLSDWAFGGEFGLSLKEPNPAFGEDSVFRGYRAGLIARNLFRASHRAAISGDIDSRGNLVVGHFAYGLPRFVAESIQFDSALSLVESRERYFETEGFGLKAQGLWTRQRGGFDLLYGVGWYSNSHRRYRLEEWPDTVAGPKIGIVKETRFLGFLPSSGYRLSIAVLPSLFKRDQSILETELAGTWAFWSHAALSVSGRSINSGTKAVSTRAEGKLEFPLASASRGLRSMFYMGVRNGQDHYKNVRLIGTESFAGYRYHSTGFIGDISFRMTGEYPWQNSPLDPYK